MRRNLLPDSVTSKCGSLKQTLQHVLQDCKPWHTDTGNLAWRSSLRQTGKDLEHTLPFVAHVSIDTQQLLAEKCGLLISDHTKHQTKRWLSKTNKPMIFQENYLLNLLLEVADATLPAVTFDQSVHGFVCHVHLLPVHSGVDNCLWHQILLREEPPYFTIWTCWNLQNLLIIIFIYSNCIEKSMTLHLLHPTCGK